MASRKAGVWTLWISVSDGSRKYVYSWTGSGKVKDFYSASSTAVEFSSKKAVKQEADELLATRDIPDTRWIYARSPGGIMYYLHKGKDSNQRRNPSKKPVFDPSRASLPMSDGSMYKAIDQRQAEGRRRAKEAEADIRRKMQPVDRYQPTWALRNMIKALKMQPWRNTVDDWQRLYEAQYILKLRRSRGKTRRNPVRYLLSPADLRTVKRAAKHMGLGWEAIAARPRTAAELVALVDEFGVRDGCDKWAAYNLR